MQRRQGLGRPPVRATMPHLAVGSSLGEATEGGVEARHGRDLARRKAPPAAPKPKGMEAAASRPSTPAFTAPAAPTSTTFNAGLDVDVDSAQEVFDGMPTSDRSFVDLMDEAVNMDDFSLSNAYMMDEAAHMDEAYANKEVFEVTPTAAKKKWARSSNYSLDEDEALVKAWESVSLDPVIGVDQNVKTYWKRIADHFYRNVKTPSSRTINSLSHRWSTIQECCNRWAGCVDNLERAPPSGTTFQDRINHCHALYKQRDPKHKTFSMMHEHNEKWKLKKNDCDPTKKVSSKSSVGLAQVHEEDEGEEASPTLRSEAPTNKRPPGRKLEKERIKKGGDHAVFQTAVQEMMATRKELEAEKKQEKESRWVDIKAIEARKVAIEEERLRVLEKELQTKKVKQECKIMFMDTSGFDETQKAYVLIMRAQILESRMKGRGSGNGSV